MGDKENRMPRTESEGSQLQNQALSAETLAQLMIEINRCLGRSRKIRLKLLWRIEAYFRVLADLIETEETAIHRMIDLFDDISKVLVGIIGLCVSLDGWSNMAFVYDAAYDLGASLETIAIILSAWCHNNGKLFGEIMIKTFTALIDASAKNSKSWLYSEVISQFNLHILEALYRQDHCKFRERWAKKSTELMKSTTNAILDCGDFCCQNYLLTIFHAWAQWIPPGQAMPIINGLYSIVNFRIRKEFLKADDTEIHILNFLNSLNQSRLERDLIVPIKCLYGFIHEHDLNSGTEFWVNFSSLSGRLTALYSMPGHPLVTLNILREQVDSICVNWVISDGQTQPEDRAEYTETQTQSTSSTFQKNEKVIFLHFVLNVDFEKVSTNVESLIGKGYKSIYFVFRDRVLVETVIRTMGYNQHRCGTMKCERPKTLREKLKTINRLSYTQSWCPQSQISTLDKSPFNSSRYSNTEGNSTPSRILRRIASPRHANKPVISANQPLSSLIASQSQEFSQIPESQDVNTSYASVERTPGRKYFESSDETTANSSVDVTPGRKFFESSDDPTMYSSPEATPGAKYLGSANAKKTSTRPETTPARKYVENSGGKTLARPETTPGRKYVEDSDAKKTLARPETTPGRKYVESADAKKTFVRPETIPGRKIVGISEAKKTSASVDTTPGRKYVEKKSHKNDVTRTPLKSQKQLKAIPSSTVSETPGKKYCQDLRRSSQSFAESLHDTSSAYYVSVTSHEEGESMSNDEDQENNEMNMNETSTTMATEADTTFAEDPLPKNRREKYAHLFQHEPFTPYFRQLVGDQRAEKNVAKTAEQTYDLDETRDAPEIEKLRSQPEPTTPLSHRLVRNSSPRADVEAQISNILASPISTICSPDRNVFNLTEVEVENIEIGDEVSVDVEDEEDLDAENKDDSKDLNVTQTIIRKRLSTIPEADESLSPIIGKMKTLFQKSPGSTKSKRSPKASIPPSPVSSASSPDRSVFNITEVDLAEDGDESDVEGEDAIKNSNATQPKVQRKLSTIPEVDESFDLSPIVGYSKTLLPKSPHSSKSKRGPTASIPTSPVISLCSSDQNIFSESEEEDAENEDSKTGNKTPTKGQRKLSTIPESDESLSLSPIVGYSKTLLPKSPHSSKSKRGPASSIPASPVRSLYSPDKSVFSETDEEDAEDDNVFGDRNKTPTKVRGKSSAIRESDESLSLSPIVGYSKTLLPKSPRPRSSKSKREPCYSGASRRRDESQLEKRQDSNFDPYDIRNCSEATEFEQHLFPELKLKTYPGRKVSKAEHRANAQKRKLPRSTSPPKSKKGTSSTSTMSKLLKRLKVK